LESLLTLQRLYKWVERSLGVCKVGVRIPVGSCHAETYKLASVATI